MVDVDVLPVTVKHLGLGEMMLAPWVCGPGPVPLGQELLSQLLVVAGGTYPAHG